METETAAVAMRRWVTCEHLWMEEVAEVEVEWEGEGVGWVFEIFTKLRGLDLKFNKVEGSINNNNL